MGLFPFLRELKEKTEMRNFSYFFKHLTTQVVQSDARDFKFVDFIDSPGLTGGRVEYNCDIECIVRWLAEYVDAILVFFDPIGQALRKKTLKLYKFLCERYPDKVKGVLGKVDQVGSAGEYCKLHGQIVATIAHSIGLQASAVILPISVKEPCTVENKVLEVCEIIGKSMDACLNISIIKAKEDCILIREHCKLLITHDEELAGKQRINFVLILALVLLTGWLFLEHSEAPVYYYAAATCLCLALATLNWAHSASPLNYSHRNRLQKYLRYSEECLETITLT